LLATTLAVSGLALLLPYLGRLASIFGFVPLPGPIVAAVILTALAYIVANEVAKRWYFR
jgi:Mg2+-importing ATPase